MVGGNRNVKCVAILNVSTSTDYSCELQMHYDDVESSYMTGESYCEPKNKG